ncbi:MAG: hypothetical protein IKW30_02580 [Lachnospiraceae bacterium]|nr:hypothetical protein [Lachnospiraceae bacterium]
MRFLKEMYVGEGIKNKQKVLWKLKHGAGMIDIYVISLANGNDQLDCTLCSYFKQKFIREHVGLVVGIAKGYSEAQGLIVSMIEESLRETGSANVKEYIMTFKQ